MGRSAFQRVLSSAMPRSTLGAQAADQLVASRGVRMQMAILDRSVDAGTGAVVALVGQRRPPQQRGRGVQRAEEAGAPGGGQVVGGAGFDRRDRHREPLGVAHDLHVAAVGVVLAGVPQVMAGVGVDRSAPVGGEQRAVQRHVGPAGGLTGLDHLVQVRCLGGEHVDAFVQIAVAGGDRDPGIGGEQLHVGVLAEPAQHQDRLSPGRGGAGADAVPRRSRSAASSAVSSVAVSAGTSRVAE
jgi:hypothetical protein